MESKAESEIVIPFEEWDENWKNRWNIPLRWGKRTHRIGDFSDWVEGFRKHIVINPQSCALVPVDLDKAALDTYIEDMYEYDRDLGKALYQRCYGMVVPNIIRIVEFFRQNHLPIFFLEWDHYQYFYPQFEPRSGEEMIRKIAPGAFGSSSYLDMALRRKDIETIFITGMDTVGCVESVVRGAVDCQYQIVLVEDACASFRQDLHEAAIKSLGFLYAYITTTEKVISDYPWNGWEIKGYVEPWLRKQLGYRTDR